MSGKSKFVWAWIVSVTLWCIVGAQFSHAATIRSYLFADKYVKKADENLLIGMAFNRSVRITGNPVLKFSLASDGSERIATFEPSRSGIRKDGSTIISFVYRVQKNEVSDGLVLGIRPVDETKGQLRLASNGQKITPRLPQKGRTLPVLLDGTAPRIVNAQVQPQGGILPEDARLSYIVQFSEDVIVSGMPYIPILVKGQGYTLEDKAWFDRQQSTPQRASFSWRGEEANRVQSVRFDDTIAIDHPIDRIADYQGNELEDYASGIEAVEYSAPAPTQVSQATPQQKTQSTSASDQLKASRKKTPTRAQKLDQTAGGIVFSLGLGVHSVVSKNKRTKGNFSLSSSKVATNSQPLLEGQVGYNFHAYPSRLIVAATLGVYGRSYKPTVSFKQASGTSKANLDSDAVANPEVFGGASLYWKPRPKGFGLIGRVRSDQYVILVLLNQSKAALVNIATLGAAAGADYHFDVVGQRMGVYGLLETQSAQSSKEDDNQLAKALSNVVSYEAGVEWRYEPASRDSLWYNAKLYYSDAMASVDNYNFSYAEVGLTFGLHY